MKEVKIKWGKRQDRPVCIVQTLCYFIIWFKFLSVHSYQCSVAAIWVSFKLKIQHYSVRIDLPFRDDGKFSLAWPAALGWMVVSTVSIGDNLYAMNFWTDGPADSMFIHRMDGVDGLHIDPTHSPHPLGLNDYNLHSYIRADAYLATNPTNLHESGLELSQFSNEMKKVTRQTRSRLVTA